MSADKAHTPARVKMASIDQDHLGQRIDNYLMSQLKGVPRSHIYRLLAQWPGARQQGPDKAALQAAAGRRGAYPAGAD